MRIIIVSALAVVAGYAFAQQMTVDELTAQHNLSTGKNLQMIGQLQVEVLAMRKQIAAAAAELKDADEAQDELQDAAD